MTMRKASAVLPEWWKYLIPLLVGAALYAAKEFVDRSREPAEEQTAASQAQVDEKQESQIDDLKDDVSEVKATVGEVVVEQKATNKGIDRLADQLNDINDELRSK